LELLWRSNLPQGHIYHGTSYADIDNDGNDELLIGSYDGKVYAINSEDGSLHWSYEYSEESFYYVGAPVTIADINNDEKYEIIFCNFNIVGVLSEEGELLWNYRQNDYGTTFRGTVVSDIDDDNYLDIIFGNSNGELTALSGFDNSVLFCLDLAEHFGKEYNMDSAPLVADFDKDGFLDVFITGGLTNYPDVENNYGRAYLVSTAKGNGPDWLMFQRNHLRNASINFEKSSIKDNIINSFDYSNQVFLSLDEIFDCFDLYENINMIEIYGLNGNLLVKELICNRQNIINTLNSMSSGIYYLRILSRNNQKLLYYLKM